MANDFCTYFSTPQWGWVEAESPETHSTLDNLVEVSLLADSPDSLPDYLPVTKRYVDVPLGFFQFTRQVLGIEDLSAYYMYLDQMAPRVYLFGLCRKNDPHDIYPLLDLWVWTPATAPSFLVQK